LIFPLSGAKNGATQIERNPVNGDLILNGNLFTDNSKPYRVFGNNGKTLTVNTALGIGLLVRSVSPSTAAVTTLSSSAQTKPTAAEQT
jgi:hypothetical protein